MSHFIYLIWHMTRCDSRAILTKKAQCGSVINACRNDDSLEKVILDIHRTGNFIRAKLQYRQLSALDKLFRLRRYGEPIRLVDDKFVRFRGITSKSSKSASIKDRLARKSSKSHRVGKKLVDHNELFIEIRCTIIACRCVINIEISQFDNGST